MKTKIQSSKKDGSANGEILGSSAEGHFFKSMDPTFVPGLIEFQPLC
jgi:hypothetical protein